MQWAHTIEPHLSQVVARVETPTVAAAVDALLTHIESFFGGPPYVFDEDGVDAVSIAPLDKYGLIALESTWFWCAVAYIFDAGSNSMTPVTDLWGRVFARRS